MDLLELTKDLFSYLVVFREKVGTAASPTLEEVRRDLDGIFQQMEEQTRRRPSLAGPYRQVKYALAAFADEIILTSAWDQASGWEAQLLELEFFGTNVAGDRFFELLASLDDAPRQVIAVYFRCLALGFSGRYAIGSQELEQAKRDLLARLKVPSPEFAGRLAPQGYEGVMVERGRLSRLMSWRFGLLLILGVALGLFLFDRFVLWPWLTWDAIKVSSVAQTRLEESALRSTTTLKTQQKAKGQKQPVNSILSREQKLKAQATATTSPQKAPKAGLKPSAPVPVGSPVLSEEEELWQRGFLVQVGNYVGAKDAQRMTEKLSDAGLPAWTIQKFRSEGKVWHVVLVGPYRKFSHAQQVKKSLAERMNLSPVIVDAKDYGRRGSRQVAPSVPVKSATQAKPVVRPKRTMEKRPEPLFREKTSSEVKPAATKTIPKAADAPRKKPAGVDKNARQMEESRLAWQKGFLVQLGTFVGPRDSRRLAGKVSGAGFKVWIIDKPRPGGKAWYVVACGPFLELEKAQQAMVSLESEFGLKPLVIDAKDYVANQRKLAFSSRGYVAADSPKRPSAGREELWRQGFLVQVGVFVGPRDSARLAAKLEKAGLEAQVLDKPRGGGKVWHVVAVGPFKGYREADGALREIEEKFGLRPIIVDAGEFAGTGR